MLPVRGTRVASLLAGGLLLGSLLFLAGRPELPQARAWARSESGVPVQRLPSGERRFLLVPTANEARPQPTIEPASCEPSRIVLELVGAEGEPLVKARCELLLSVWGDTKRVELTTRGNVLEIGLDDSWLKGQWDLDTQYMNGRILVRAPEHAPLSSDTFYWIGGRHGSRIVERAEIHFPRGQGFEISRGETVHGRLALRRPGTRILRLVDTEDQPLVGLPVGAALFWSNENHCGVVSGAESLGEFTSDAYGQIEIPDGNHEYALSFHTWGIWHHCTLADPQNTYAPMRWIGWLEDETTTIRFRWKEVAPLRLRVTRDGNPAIDVDLYANIGWAGCGATWGLAGQPDAKGRILVEEFWYEGMDRIWLQDAAGERLWSTDPRELERDRELVVELP
jgi:hypothetical protein